MAKVGYEMQVPFYDVDSYRIVWHGSYPKYFEKGRCQLLEEIGFAYDKMEQTGFFFPVVDLQVKYVKPITFKQNIKVESSIKHWENKLVIDYLVLDVATGEVLTRAQTSQVAVKMPEKITQFQSPPELITAVERWLERR